MKQRTADDTMKALKGVKLDTFGVVHERGFGVVRDLSARRNNITVDWRLQRSNERARMHQIVEITINGVTAQVARQELERYLSHS